MDKIRRKNTICGIFVEIAAAAQFALALAQHDHFRILNGCAFGILGVLLFVKKK